MTPGFSRLMASLVGLLIVVSRPAMSGAGELTIHSDFPGGSAEVRGIDSKARAFEIAPANHADHGWPCWWYFRVDGATPGEKLTFKIVGSDRPYRDGRRLTANWSLPRQAAISTDDAVWTQTPPGEIGKESGVYVLTAPAERFWLAWGPPFLPSHAEALLAEVHERLPDSQRFVLAHTRDGRPVPGIRLGSDDLPHAIWVQARQHAWEAGGSWVGRGFLDWVAGDSPEAVALRRTTQIIFIPIMDVDNVSLGAGGKDAVPRDHNRDWADEPTYPEVAAAQKEIMALIQTRRLRIYVDLHNPAPSDRSPYFYGPFQYELLPPELRRRYDRLLELAIANIGDPLPMHRQYRFATYVQSDDERGRMSSEWVRRRAGDLAVALTLETAWNTPHNTTADYETVGQGLARTLASYLGE